MALTHNMYFFFFFENAIAIAIRSLGNTIEPKDLEGLKKNVNTLLNYFHKAPAFPDVPVEAALPPASEPAPPSSSSSADSAPPPDPVTEEQMIAFSKWCEAEVAGRPDQHHLLREYLRLF